MLIFHLFLQISEICFQKAIVQYITFKTAALYLRKIKVFVNISKKPKYPFLLFSALFAENHQKFNKNDGITSILLIDNTFQPNLLQSIYYNFSNYPKPFLMTIVLLNSTKIKPRQHILAVPLVTSLGIIRSEV